MSSGFGDPQHGDIFCTMCCSETQLAAFSLLSLLLMVCFSTLAVWSARCTGAEGIQNPTPQV